ncbi:energy-coupling factor ABC transporter permease [Photobacterium sp. SDRW27]|uniref:energy-coupling factor ABC transporter permease n=1 Tax=Photobacterium obscurum TaxID=2829490 RepID=UPI002244544D|nr:energy-coupling factor ABC transporter permease [Photobacterium obscurum]MCW8331612.1 energy-coupling factor ABC transporter permease [Photobacterium obscurum]
MTILQWGGYLVWLGILAFSLPREFWPKFRAEKDYQHLVLASVVVLFLLWSLRAGIAEGLQVHFLAITVLVLSHGWRIAGLIGSFPLIFLSAIGLVSWQDTGLHALTGVIFPVLFSYAVFLFSYRFMARHLFVYIFVAAFLNGALTMIIHLLLTSGWMYLAGHYSWSYIVDNYLVLLPLLLFPEALINGMAMTLLVVYKPEWVRTFADRDYINSSNNKDE